jgi:hypothetical protein
MGFSQAWDALHGKLTVGLVIKNWTRDKGFIGDDFDVIEVAQDRIEVGSPNATNIQRVPRADFQLIYADWTNYRDGVTSRSELRDRTRFSKYIISIWHWLESESGGHIP